MYIHHIQMTLQKKIKQDKIIHFDLSNNREMLMEFYKNGNY